jgi:hypothetical protein
VLRAGINMSSFLLVNGRGPAVSRTASRPAL